MSPCQSRWSCVRFSTAAAVGSKPLTPSSWKLDSSSTQTSGRCSNTGPFGGGGLIGKGLSSDSASSIASTASSVLGASAAAAGSTSATGSSATSAADAASPAPSSSSAVMQVVVVLPLVPVIASTAGA